MINFEPIIVQALQKLVQEPVRFNQITVSLLETLAKRHNLHNKLLPSCVIEHFLQHCLEGYLVGTMEEAAKFLLFFNCLRTVVLANFQQLKNNKLYRVLSMIYALTINNIFSKQERAKMSQNYTIKLVNVFRGLLLNEIIMKFISRTHHCFPEYYRFIKYAFEVIAQLLSNIPEGKFSQKFLVEAKAIPNNIPPKVFQIAFSDRPNQKFRRDTLLLLTNSLINQSKRFLSISGKKQAMTLTVVRQIQQQIQAIKKIAHKNELIHIEETIFEGNSAEDQPALQETIFLQETLAVRQLTPRFYDQEQTTILKGLRRKRSKLQKKIHLGLRKDVHNKLQENKVREDIKKERARRREKKEIFILQKQTEEAKAYHRKLGKVKQIKKGKGTTEKVKGSRHFRGNKGSFAKPKGRHSR